MKHRKQLLDAIEAGFRVLQLVM